MDSAPLGCAITSVNAGLLSPDRKCQGCRISVACMVKQKVTWWPAHNWWTDPLFLFEVFCYFHRCIKPLVHLCILVIQSIAKTPQGAFSYSHVWHKLKAQSASMNFIFNERLVVYLYYDCSSWLQARLSLSPSDAWPTIWALLLP